MTRFFLSGRVPANAAGKPVRTKHNILVRFFVACACWLPLVQTAAAANQKPNLVFLLADDLGWADLGCYGSAFHETPNLDRMARDGVRFSTFYSAGSVCSPTRSSIMTGKYPVRTGITDWIPGQEAPNRKLVQLRPRTQLPHNEVTLAESMKTGGYQTAYIGKWHLGRNGSLPTDHGFELYLGEDRENAGATDNIARLRQRLESTDRYTDFATDFLEKRDPSRPFFLMLSYHDVHTPIQPMPGLVEHFQKRAGTLSGPTPERPEHDGRTRLRQDNPSYASMLAAVDISAGRILSKLKDLRLASNTIVFFASDNGGLSTLKNAGPTSNTPLRAGKGWLYEGGIRVPLIVWGTAVTQTGSVCETPLISCDLYPTFLELAHLSPLPRQHIDGVSFAELLRGGPAQPARSLFWHYPHYHGSTWTPGAAIRDGNWKLIEFYESGAVELYNLSADLAEAYNHAASNQAKKQELLQKLHNWQKSVQAQIPPLNPNPESSAAPDVREKKKKRAGNRQ